jgi:hypothetical protein
VDDPLSTPDMDCWAAPLPEPRRQPIHHNPESICEIDPGACPRLECRGECIRAKWTLWRPPVCSTGPERSPRFLEVGKARPLDDWAFPFVSANDGIECTGERYLRRVRPELDASPFAPMMRR